MHSALAFPDDVAALVVGLSRYTTGLQIELAVRCRIDPDPGDRMHSTVEAGLFAGPVLTHWGGGGGREWSSTLWLTPAPRPGDLVLVIADAAPASTRRVPPWRPKGFELRSRRLRSCGRASLIGRLRPFSHRSSTYRSRAGYFRR